jgi:hypothetical protein
MAVGIVLAAQAASAQVTGSFDGGLTPRKTTDLLGGAAVFTQTDKLVSGTIVLPAELSTFDGAYLVTGKATPKRVKVSGMGVSGAVLKYKGKIVGDSISGKAKLKGPTGKLIGTLALTRNTSTSDGSGCDQVYTDNQTTFATDVLGTALAACESCHAPGLQAASTRLHVNAADPLATARQIAVLIDSASPGTSRIIEKPLNVLPHGGGVQIHPASTELTLLQQWVDLVAAAACN